MRSLPSHPGALTVAAIAAVALAVAGWGVFEGTQTPLETDGASVKEAVAQGQGMAAPKATDEPEASPSSDPAQDTQVSVEEGASPDRPDKAPELQTQPPAFDEVRREPDGITVIAGRAAPDAEIGILQNGEEIGTARTDGSGKFATVLMLPPRGDGQILSLRLRVEETDLASEDQIILAPL